LFLPQNLPDMDQPIPDKVGLSLRLVDGIGYANLDKLAALDTAGDLPRGWVGVDLVDFFRQAMDSQMGSMPSMPDMSANMDMMSAFYDPEFMDTYITVTRADDTTVDGQSAAVFNQAVDLGELFSSEQFQNMMRDQIDAASGSSGLSADDMESVMGIYSTLFDGFVINTTQTIGLEDHFVHQVNMSLDWSLDFSGMAASFGGSSATQTPPINISFDFQGGLSQFNNAPEITAPENAVIMPLDKLFNRGGF